MFDRSEEKDDADGWFFKDCKDWLIECVEEEVVDDNKVEFVSDAFDDGVFDVEIWVDDAIGETCDDFPVDDVFIE